MSVSLKDAILLSSQEEGGQLTRSGSTVLLGASEYMGMTSEGLLRVDGWPSV